MRARRRPILRGAMVGGAGYMAGKAGARRAEGSQAGTPPPAPAPSAAPAEDKIERLKQLGELRDSGVLTAEEFEREKQKLLAS